MISEELWEILKKDAGDKKIFLIKESENMFILKDLINYCCLSQFYCCAHWTPCCPSSCPSKFNSSSVL